MLDRSWSREFYANFKNVSLNGVTMIGGSGVGANFEDADLGDAYFEGVDFSPTEVLSTAANLENAASLKNTTFKGVTGLSPEQVSLCRVKGAVFVDESRASIGP